MSEVCPCHGLPWYIYPGGKRAGTRTCQLKLQASLARYRGTEKQKAVQQRYNKTPKGRANQARANAKRVFDGMYYLGRTRRAESAAALTQMARDFRAQQKEMT